MHKIHRLPVIAATLVLAAGPLFASPETYKIDPVHSTIGFKVRHLVANVTGRFADVSGLIKVDPDHPETSSVEATIKVASITTSNAQRDTHLKSPDFFDAAKFADMTFKSKSVIQLDKSTADVTGDLTIHGVTKEVVLHVAFLGKANGPGGAPQTGWEATAKINRIDFGLVWNKMIEGISMVGDDVEITLEIESNRVK
jgi:polyisoprenoid-binding protein YceI